MDDAANVRRVSVSSFKVLNYSFSRAEGNDLVVQTVLRVRTKWMD